MDRKKALSWGNGAGMVAVVVGLLAAAHALQLKDRPWTDKGTQGRANSGTHSQGDPRTSAATQAPVQAALGKLPLYFIENHGQLDARVAYYVQGRDTSLYFTAQGLTLALSSTAPQPAALPGPRDLLHPVAWKPEAEPSSARQRYVLKLDFVGANPQVKPSGQEPTPAVISYFKGPKEQWQTGLPTYASVVYPDLWPGIDLVYSGTVDHLKYTFVVQPGADPQQIQLAYQGATAVRLTEGGQLEVVTPLGSLEDARPQAYQEVGAERVEVTTAYALEAPGQEGAYQYGFRVGAYDRSKALVIDPAVLVYAGYIGGSGSDLGTGIAVDSAGNAYVTGYTFSTEATFPVTGGPDLTFNGFYDAFVAKVRADGTALLYAGYIGGNGPDGGTGIAVDAAGNAYVTGFTNSTEATFPVTGGPDLTFNGDTDAFVAKVSSFNQEVAIDVDIKPGRNPNCLKATSNGVLSVALLGSTSVKVATIKVRTLQLDDDSDPATAGVAPRQSAFRDVDHDGNLDLILHFRTPALRNAGLLIDGHTLFLTGTLLDGTPILGSDVIFLVGGPPCS